MGNPRLSVLRITSKCSAGYKITSVRAVLQSTYNIIAGMFGHNRLYSDNILILQGDASALPGSCSGCSAVSLTLWVLQHVLPNILLEILTNMLLVIVFNRPRNPRNIRQRTSGSRAEVVGMIDNPAFNAAANGAAAAGPSSSSGAAAAAAAPAGE